MSILLHFLLTEDCSCKTCISLLAFQAFFSVLSWCPLVNENNLVFSCYDRGCSSVSANVVTYCLIVLSGLSSNCIFSADGWFSDIVVIDCVCCVVYPFDWTVSHVSVWLPYCYQIYQYKSIHYTLTDSLLRFKITSYSKRIVSSQSHVAGHQIHIYAFISQPRSVHRPAAG